MAAKTQEYTYYAKCWGKEVWVAARDFQQAKRFILADNPEIRRLVKKGAPLHVERQGTL